MSAKTKIQIGISILMTLLVAGLLLWQETRYRMISECLSRGMQWDGRTSSCRPVPKIIIDRGLRNTGKQ